jgi:hypothetical protein
MRVHPLQMSGSMRFGISGPSSDVTCAGAALQRISEVCRPMSSIGGQILDVCDRIVPRGTIWRAVQLANGRAIDAEIWCERRLVCAPALDACVSARIRTRPDAQRLRCWMRKSWSAKSCELGPSGRNTIKLFHVEQFKLSAYLTGTPESKTRFFELGRACGNRHFQLGSSLRRAASSAPIHRTV